MALGEVPALSPPGGDPRQRVIDGLQGLRARWGLPALQVLDEVPYCGPTPDAIGAVEVTRYQSCREVPAWGDGGGTWDALAQRPFALQSIGDPRAHALQVAVDREASVVVIRTAERFERLDAPALQARLLEGLRARWPDLRHDPAPEAFGRLAERWAAEGALTEEAMTPLAGAADDAAGRWSPEPSFLRVMAGAQTVDQLLSFVPADTPAPTVAAIGVAPGAGPDGEPFYFAVIALATP